MIKVKFISKNETIRAQVPERWEEITLKQFLALENLTKPLEVLSVVMGIDLSFIENTSTNLTPVMNRVIEIFNARPVDLENRKPKGFGFQGQLIKLPRDIENMMFGQLIQINELLQQNVNSNLLKIMAIAVQPIIDGEFIEANQDKYETLIGNLPINEVYPEMFFFAEKLKKHKRYGLSDFNLYI